MKKSNAFAYVSLTFVFVHTKVKFCTANCTFVETKSRKPLKGIL